MIEIFYGISGTGKTTLAKRKDRYHLSGIKEFRNEWKSSFEGFDRFLPLNDLSFAHLHLYELRKMINDDSNVGVGAYGGSVGIERGVTDMLFFWELHGGEHSDELCNKLVKEEAEILGDVKKTLLVMKDRDFISDVILAEPQRRDQFPGGVEQYLEIQNTYVEFTKKWNKIDKETTIYEASKFIY